MLFSSVARLSSAVFPSGRNAALLKSNSSSEAKLTLRVCVAGAAASTGAGADATGAGAAASAFGINCESHSAVALAGVHEPERQHRPVEFFHTIPWELYQWPGSFLTCAIPVT